MNPEFDLSVLVADDDQGHALEHLLPRLRPKPLPNRRWFRIHTHPHHDPGCVKTAHELLRSHTSTARFALVVLDFHGSGVEHKSTREALAETIKANLERNGWPERAEAVVIEPEIEQWLFPASQRLSRIIGWSPQRESMSTWLEARNLHRPGDTKPRDPKKA